MPPGAMPPGAMPPPGPMPPPGEVPQEGGMMKPASLPAGASLPEGGSMPQGGAVPENMMPKPKQPDARPYIKRSLQLLRRHKNAVILTTVLTLIGSLLPFVVSASFGPLLEILGNAAREGRMENVWTLPGSLYKPMPPPGSEPPRGSLPPASSAPTGSVPPAGSARPPGSVTPSGTDGTPTPPLTGIWAWLATPISFKTIFLVWAIATIGSAVLRFVQMWLTSNLEQKIVAEIQGKVYDHLQTLSLDFFTGGKTGGLMQRVLNESQNVQKLITQVLLTPILDVFVLIVALVYLSILSWKMTLVSFALGV